MLGQSIEVVSVVVRKDGELIEDSSLRCHTTEEGGQEEGVGVAIGGPRICWQWTTKLARKPSWETPTKLARRPAWEVGVSRFELPR